MKKHLRILLILLGVILLLSSFPVRDILGYRTLSDMFRLIGFVLVIIISVISLFGKKKN